MPKCHFHPACHTLSIHTYNVIFSPQPCYVHTHYFHMKAACSIHFPLIQLLIHPLTAPPPPPPYTNYFLLTCLSSHTIHPLPPPPFPSTGLLPHTTHPLPLPPPPLFTFTLVSSFGLCEGRAVRGRALHSTPHEHGSSCGVFMRIKSEKESLNCTSTPPFQHPLNNTDNNKAPPFLPPSLQPNTATRRYFRFLSFYAALKWCQCVSD